jgi:mannitol-specific phosphotransferase system IIBC component
MYIIIRKWAEQIPWKILYILNNQISNQISILVITKFLLKKKKWNEEKEFQKKKEEKEMILKNKKNNSETLLETPAISEILCFILETLMELWNTNNLKF